MSAAWASTSDSSACGIFTWDGAKGLSSSSTSAQRNSSSPRRPSASEFSANSPCPAHHRYRLRKPRSPGALSRNACCYFSLLLHRVDGAGVIVDDSPALREPLPNQGEHAPDVTLGARQMPVPQNQGGIGPEKPILECGELQLAHALPVGIALFVPRSHRLPPAGNSAGSGKGNFR